MSKTTDVLIKVQNGEPLTLMEKIFAHQHLTPQEELLVRSKLKEQRRVFVYFDEGGKALCVYDKDWDHSGGLTEFVEVLK
jgi:hypothetical protein